jgi:hypothetical protein
MAEFAKWRKKYAERAEIPCGEVLDPIRQYLKSGENCQI